MLKPPDRPDPRERYRERMRRYRLRQLDGRLSVVVEITPSETVKLARLEYLREAELEDRKRVAEAIRLLLEAIVLDV